MQSERKSGFTNTTGFRHSEHSRVGMYLAYLLPALRKIHTTPGVLKRRRAIKFAADMSLAHAAKACNWSRALNLRLLGMRTKRRRGAATFGGQISGSLSYDLACTVKQRRHSHCCCDKINVGRGKSVNAARRRRSRSVDVRVRTLQKLVPGGPKMKPDILFRETADYILSLQMQVHVMQTLANLSTKSPPLRDSGCNIDNIDLQQHI